MGPKEEHELRDPWQIQPIREVRLVDTSDDDAEPHDEKKLNELMDEFLADAKSFVESVVGEVPENGFEDEDLVARWL